VLPVLCYGVTVAVLCAYAAIIKSSLLPIHEGDRKALRVYCTTAGCGMGVTVKKKVKKKVTCDDGSIVEVEVVEEVLKPAMMSPAEFAKKPSAFLHKYCMHHTPDPAEQERRLRDIPALFPGLMDPSSPGQLLFREGGPVLKALEQLILLVRDGKLQGGQGVADA
jgi:hypothetical protein